MNIILYASQQDQNFQWVILAIAMLLIIGLIIMLLWQQRTGRELTTELAQLEKEKHRSVEFDFVLKAMGLSIWHINTDSGEIFFDKDFREKSEDQSIGIEGGSINDNSLLLVEEDATRINKALSDLCAGVTEEYHEQYRVKVAHSAKTYWEESYAIIADRDISGHPSLIVGTTQRIDASKAMETALKQALAKAEESDRLKSAFIANMSHEIRTPLNAIIGFTSVLPDLDNRDERQEIINLIQENNQKLLRIIDDVMNISKIEAGKEQLQISVFDINIILDELVNKYRARLSPGVEMTTLFAALQLEISSDMSRVMESMGHLISNAVKFTSNGSIVVGYDEVKEHRLRLWVKDTGKGISRENLERVFERFFKVDEYIPGAGLGLSICRTMAYSLGGDVGVDSILGKGSTFWMEIPA